MFQENIEKENQILKKKLNERLYLLKEMESKLENVLKKSNLNIFDNFKVKNSSDKSKLFIFKEIITDFIKESFLELKYIKYHSQFLNDKTIDFSLKNSFKTLKKTINLTLIIETDYILTKKGLFIA